MMKIGTIIPQIIITILLIIMLLQEPLSLADPRAQTIKSICGTKLEHNITVLISNFILVMENISVQMRNSGFGISQVVSGLNTTYALAQCYRDLSVVDCVLCYAEARTNLPRCYPLNGGRIYLDGCFMRAENYSFFDEYMGPDDQLVCGNGTRQDSSRFEDSVRRGLSQVVLAAPVNGGYSRVEVAVTGTQNGSVYVLADCWRTLNESSCRSCLENAFKSVSGCLPSSEGRALNTGCFMRYSDVNFLNPILRNGNSKGKVIAIVTLTVCAAVVFIIGASIGVYMWKHHMIQMKRKGDADKLVKTLHDSSLNFRYSTLEKATGSFDEANKLGQGGFGAVYKGVLADGREIAVKRLFFNNKHRAGDFYNEVNIISSVQHKNLVRLLGCSCSGPESLLVYEFLPNSSLDRYIFDSNEGKKLNWEKRFEIIKGTAEGLVYLHENTNMRIIHRDIKASNIILDSRLRAKIADFGLARSFQEDKSHISTAIAGTLGYIAPEYLAHGQLTEKADVYSFGVLLLEIVTGKENNRSKATEDSDSTIVTAWNHFRRRTVEEIFDPNLLLLDNNYYDIINITSEIARVVHVGLLCTQEIPTLRPSMSKALLMLVKKENQLPEPTRPPFMYSDNDASENPALKNGNNNKDSVASISESIFLPR